MTQELPNALAVLLGVLLGVVLGIGVLGIGGAIAVLIFDSALTFVVKLIAWWTWKEKVL